MRLTPLRDVDGLARKFGDQRFTVAQYIGGIPTPGEVERYTLWFNNLVAEGRLESSVGPRGGKGYKFTADEMTRFAARDLMRLKREAASRKAINAEMDRTRQVQIEKAISLLQRNGYAVNKLPE